MDGVQYLYDRLHGKVRLSPARKNELSLTFALSQEESVETVVTRHNVSQKLSLCAEKLSRIYEQVKSKEDLIEVN
jgi:hypothetical protein